MGLHAYVNVSTHVVHPICNYVCVVTQEHTHLPCVVCAVSYKFCGFFTISEGIYKVNPVSFVLYLPFYIMV